MCPDRPSQAEAGDKHTINGCGGRLEDCGRWGEETFGNNQPEEAAVDQNRM